MQTAAQVPPQAGVSLFERRSPEVFRIGLKEAASEAKRAVADVCTKVGLSESVKAVFQPSASAEINSQNYIVEFESGNRLLLRRCCKFVGKERYEALYAMLNLLRECGVRVPEFYSEVAAGKVPYFEFGEADSKACWIFFKYIEAESYFAGKFEELKDAAEQIGKMHACLKHHYQERPVIAVQTIEGPSAHLVPRTGPSLTKEDWRRYVEKMEAGSDQYDEMFKKHKSAIEESVNFVEENRRFLDGPKQNIHFDLNSMNLIVDKNQRVTILDFDTLRLGSFYTDMGFALHRLMTTYAEQTQCDEKQIGETLKAFIAAYMKGNPHCDIDKDALVVAMLDRALWNLNTNLSLKYDQGSKEWLTSIPFNLKRLAQVKLLTSLI